jgi:hypothetical protein
LNADASVGSSSAVIYEYSVTPTLMRVNNHYYTIYCIWLNFIFNGIGPFVMLITLNTLMLIKLKKITSESDPVKYYSYNHLASPVKYYSCIHLASSVKILQLHSFSQSGKKLQLQSFSQSGKILPLHSFSQSSKKLQFQSFSQPDKILHFQ